MIQLPTTQRGKQKTELFRHKIRLLQKCESDRPKSQMELELAREGGKVLKDKKEKGQIVQLR